MLRTMRKRTVSSFLAALLGGCGGTSGGQQVAAAPDEAPPPKGTIAYKCDAQKIVERTTRACERLRVAGVAASGLASEADRMAAADGDLCTPWSSALEAPQSVAFDLGGTHRVDAIILVPHMEPEGKADVLIEGSQDGEEYQELERLDRSWVTGQEYEIELPSGEYHFLRVRTESSDSRVVAWREVMLLRCGEGSG